MAFTGALEDRVRITELLGRYSDAVIRADAADYLACWTDDAVRTGSGGDCCGKAELRAQWEKIWLVVERMTFFTQVAAIAVAGDRATARSYCLELLQLKDGQAQNLVGEYEDELVRDADSWLFARRSYRVVQRF